MTNMPQWKEELLNRVIQMFGFEHPRTILLANLIELCHETQKQNLIEVIELVEENYKNGIYTD